MCNNVIALKMGERTVGYAIPFTDINTMLVPVDMYDLYAVVADSDYMDHLKKLYNDDYRFVNQAWSDSIYKVADDLNLKCFIVRNLIQMDKDKNVQLLVPQANAQWAFKEGWVETSCNSHKTIQGDWLLWFNDFRYEDFTCYLCDIIGNHWRSQLNTAIDKIRFKHNTPAPTPVMEHQFSSNDVVDYLNSRLQRLREKQSFINDEIIKINHILEYLAQ